MNDLREKLANIIGREVLTTKNKDGTAFSRVEYAIIAALPDMVQPLVWGIDWRGRSFNASYTIWEFPLGFSVEHVQDGETITNPLKTLEAAKAAAQAHHVATIMQAFGVQKENEDD